MKIKSTYIQLSFLAILALYSLNLQAQNSDLTVEEYIATYKDIAIQEMERSGIPASITLAQGIHESAYGNSTLAKKANNHFGIKCASDWDGKTYYKWDDDANKSCFRVYENAMSSYIDHTELLLKRTRYAFLFKYDRKDYKSWAKGLRKAGYATDPNYPNKLIHTIEKNNLAQYDKATGTLVFDPKLDPAIKDIPLFEGEGDYRTKERSFLFKKYRAGFSKQNGASYAVSKKGESALAAAKRFGIPYKRFLRFNDLDDGDQLIDYQYIYIQPKKSKYRGNESFHKVKNDETMYEIAQYYGIKLSSLLQRNLLEEGAEPLNGEMILLKDKAARKPKLRPKNHIDAQPEDKAAKDGKDSKTISTGGSNTKGTVKIPTVKRPEPEDIKLNTPTYDSTVYADTSNINTAIVKDSAFLFINVKDTAQTYTPSINSAANPYGNSTNTTTTPSNNTNTNNSNNNNTIDNKGVNPDALFGGNTTIPPSPTNTTTKVIENPYSNNTTSTTTTNNTVVIENPYNNNTTNTTVVKTTSTTDNTTSNPTVNNTPTNGSYKIHTVSKGDTLYSLQRKYGVSVSEIKQVNYLTSNTLYLGRKLKIPVK